jgi:hypothetical protein
MLGEGEIFSGRRGQSTFLVEGFEALGFFGQECKDGNDALLLGQ